MLSGIVIGTIGSLLAMVIAILILQAKTKVALRWSKVRLFWRIVGRMSDGGISNVYLSRAEYVKYRKEQTLEAYVDSAKKQMLYIGFWLSQGIEFEQIERAMRRVLDRGGEVELVFLSPDVTRTVADGLADYLAIARPECKEKLESAWSHVKTFRDDLPQGLRGRILLKSHKEVLQESVWVRLVG